MIGHLAKNLRGGTITLVDEQSREFFVGGKLSLKATSIFISSLVNAQLCLAPRHSPVAAYDDCNRPKASLTGELPHKINEFLAATHQNVGARLCLPVACGLSFG
jgi:hypothetical protein